MGAHQYTSVVDGTVDIASWSSRCHAGNYRRLSSPHICPWAHGFSHIELDNQSGQWICRIWVAEDKGAKLHDGDEAREIQHLDVRITTLCTLVRMRLRYIHKHRGFCGTYTCTQPL